MSEPTPAPEDLPPITPPGSDVAIRFGCTCPVLDNAHGKGYMGVPGQFVMTASCPLHGELKKPMTPTLPHNGTDTSRAAADSVSPVAVASCERLVLNTIIANNGATCDQVEDQTGLSHQCASARIRGLVKRGILEDSGARFPTRSGRLAIVWTKVP